MTGTLTAGFAEPVMDAQRSFRAVLDAMARPGTIRRVGGVVPPAPLDAATAAVLLTLADNETPIWLDQAAAQCRDWLAFHCGVVFAEPGAATFAVALAGAALAGAAVAGTALAGTALAGAALAGTALAGTALAESGGPVPDLARFNSGTHEAPETAATLILQITSLGSGDPWRLRGPGIRDFEILRSGGLPADFPAIWQRNRTLFPRGIDMILCAGDTLACLPRGILIEGA
jgi:alpha-D-ribose 1-methylphosphonate 5-triphosphate synthase subunit PhnH